MDEGDRRPEGDSGGVRRRPIGGYQRNESAVLGRRRKQNVQDVVRLQLHLRLLHADLREQTAELAVHPRLQALPRLHDSAVSDEELPRYGSEKPASLGTE